jgi:TPR repeat protein
VPDQTSAAFISYCRDDQEFALRLAQDLKAAGGAVWLDQLDIKPGSSWDNAVEDALLAARQMLVVLTPTSVRSENVRDEISYALKQGKTVIPVLYMECVIPLRLERKQHIDFRADYARGLTTLLKQLDVEHPNEAVLDKAAEGDAQRQLAWKAREAEVERRRMEEQTQREEDARLAREEILRKQKAEDAAKREAEAAEELRRQQAARKAQKDAERQEREAEAKRLQELAERQQQEEAERRAREEVVSKQEAERRRDAEERPKRVAEAARLKEVQLKGQEDAAHTQSPPLEFKSMTDAGDEDAHSSFLANVQPWMIAVGLVGLCLIGVLIFHLTSRTSQAGPSEATSGNVKQNSRTSQTGPSNAASGNVQQNSSSSQSPSPSPTPTDQATPARTAKSLDSEATDDERKDDHKDAARLYQQACNMGKMDSCDSLGFLYRRGTGVSENQKEATALFQKACKGGDSYACWTQGKRYEFGTEVSKDEAQALQLFLKACNAGEADACQDIGYDYQVGYNGLAKDLVKAKQFYQKSCKLGQSVSCDYLKDPVFH